MRLEQYSVEKCPYCGETCREGTREAGVDSQAYIAGDVGGIDACLESYSTKYDSHVIQRERPKASREYIWAVQTSHPWACEVVYDSSRLGFVAVRLYSDKDGEAVTSDLNKTRQICSKHGVEPHGNRNTDMLSGKVEIVWGVQQHIATTSLNVDLLVVLMARLNDAMNELSENCTS